MSKFYIQKIYPGEEMKITKVQSFKSLQKDCPTILGITDKGGVYVLSGNGGIDLCQNWRANDAMRRAWCKLTGHKMAEIRAEIKRQKAEDAKRVREREERRMRHMAEKLGFRITKARA